MFYGLIWGPPFCHMFHFMVDGNNSFHRHLWDVFKQLLSVKVRWALVLVSEVFITSQGRYGQND